jgi:hypothetical protein
MVAAIVCKFLGGGLECRCRFSMTIFSIGAPTLHSKHLENAQLVNIFGRNTLQILTIFFFPTLPAQNTNQQKKVEKYIYLLCIFV